MPRPVIHVKTSAEAKAAWDQFVKDRGLTLASFVEVLGLHLEEAFTPKMLERLVAEARDIAHTRLRAGGPRPKG